MITLDSWHYILFLITIVAIYWQLNKSKQNLLFVFASIIFYATWDWRFIFLIFVSTSVDFIAAIRIYQSNVKNTRLFYLITSIVVNLIILGFFKYYNFFVENLNDILAIIGLNNHISTLSIILPIGISFYTFKAISYVVEVYKNETKPTNKFRDYFLLVMFFPSIIAGPIDLAKDMLRQISSKRKFQYSQFLDGIDLIMWGLVKKIVISNNLNFFVTAIFGSQKELSSLLVICGAIIFGIMLFADFSGYSDIARGSAKLLGYELKVNFKHPYLASNFSDFWKRWHISLSIFIKNYIYIPLGGSRCSKIKYIRNLLFTWFLTGLWHGATWNFILWGAVSWLFFSHK